MNWTQDASINRYLQIEDTGVNITVTDMDHEIEVEYQEFNEENKNQSPDSTQNGESCLMSFVDNNEINTAQNEANEEPRHELRSSVSASHIPVIDLTEYDQNYNYEEIRQALESFQLTGKKKKPLIAVHPNPMPARSRVTTYAQTAEKPKQRMKPRSVSRVKNKEAEEMGKNPIKAQPVNYKILRTPVLNVKVEKKPSTQIQPFKSSEVMFQQKPTLQEELYEFHARPAPKSTASANRPVIKRSSVPPTTSFMRKMKTDKIATLCEHPNNHTFSVKFVDLHHGGVPHRTTTTSQKPSRTKPEPFSFDERDKRMQQRKEEKIQKLLEEKKKREFYAKPIPKVSAGTSKIIESKINRMGSINSISSKNDKNVEPTGEKYLFKARPATVIHKKPFVPNKEERPLLEIPDFSLNTNRRAKERKEYDKKMKERQEENVCQKRNEKGKIRQIEQEEIVKFRKETVHKANPTMKKITSPQIPMLTKSRRHTHAM